MKTTTATAKDDSGKDQQKELFGIPATCGLCQHFWSETPHEYLEHQEKDPSLDLTEMRKPCKELGSHKNDRGCPLFQLITLPPT